MARRTDAPDKTSSTRAPRQRRTAAVPRGYDKARTEFEGRAQDWMRDRPGRMVYLPEDLRDVVALGLPCRACGNLVYRYGGSHEISWSREPDRHWAAGIVAVCASGD